MYNNRANNMSDMNKSNYELESNTVLDDFNSANLNVDIVAERRRAKALKVIPHYIY